MQSIECKDCKNAKSAANANRGKQPSGAANRRARELGETGPLAPEEELKGFAVPDDFQVQLFASEPMINKPINLAWDKKGRLWASSTVEYPYAAEKERWADDKGSKVRDSRDAIKILEDIDGDGKADTVTDFADGLNLSLIHI